MQTYLEEMQIISQNCCAAAKPLISARDSISTGTKSCCLH